MKKSMPIWDKRMIELMEFVCANKIKGITGKPQFIKAVGISQLATIDQVKNGKQGFRPKHFYAASKLFDVSMEWFFGFTKTMKRTSKESSLRDILQQALMMVK